MDFPLDALASAVAARPGTWERLGLQWRIQPIAPGRAKPAVASEFESATWLGSLVIWVSGETELSVVRLADYRMVNKHYDLAGPDDLEVLLDEVDALLAADRVPGAALVVDYPWTPSI